MSQTFKYKQSDEFDIEFLDASKSKIKPGHIYELWCKVMSGHNATNIAKLSQTLAIQPEQVKSLNTFIQSSTGLIVAWPTPTDQLNPLKFVLNVYMDNVKVFTTSTFESSALVDNLTPSSRYVVTVQACIKHVTECDTFSAPTNLTFSLENSLVAGFHAKKLTTNLRENSTGVLLEWSLRPNSSKSELCDISYYRVGYNGQSCLISALTPEIVEFLQSSVCTSSLIVNTTYEIGNKCADLSPIACSTEFKCSLRINNLNFNENYNVSLRMLSQNGAFERPLQQKLIKTSLGRPTGTIKLVTAFDFSQKLFNGYTINIEEPRVDQKNGRILKAYLFLVKLEDAFVESQLNASNQTAPQFSIDPMDQLYLKNLIASNELCELNVTSVMEPCVLKSYTSFSDGGTQAWVIQKYNLKISVCFHLHCIRLRWLRISMQFFLIFCYFY